MLTVVVGINSLGMLRKIYLTVSFPTRAKSYPGPKKCSGENTRMHCWDSNRDHEMSVFFYKQGGKLIEGGVLEVFTISCRKGRSQTENGNTVTYGQKESECGTFVGVSLDLSRLDKQSEN